MLADGGCRVEAAIPPGRWSKTSGSDFILFEPSLDLFGTVIEKGKERDELVIPSVVLLVGTMIEKGKKCKEPVSQAVVSSVGPVEEKEEKGNEFEVPVTPAVVLICWNGRRERKRARSNGYWSLWHRDQIRRSASGVRRALDWREKAVAKGREPSKYRWWPQADSKKYQNKKVQRVSKS